MLVLPTWMSMYHVCDWCQWRPEEDTGFPGTRVTDDDELQRGCWELKIGPLREQPALLTAAPPLQPLVFNEDTTILLWPRHFHISFPKMLCLLQLEMLKVKSACSWLATSHSVYNSAVSWLGLTANKEPREVLRPSAPGCALTRALCSPTLRLRGRQTTTTQTEQFQP